MLELCRYITGQVASGLEGKILRAVLDSKRMAHHLFLATEVVSVALVITAEVVASAAVADQDGVATFDGLTLALHSEVRVKRVDDPDASEGSVGMHGGLIKARDRRVGVLAFGGRGAHEGLAEGIWVRLNTDFLTVAHDIVAAEDVHTLLTDDLEDGTVGWANLIFRSGREHVPLIGARAPIVGVKSEPATSLLVLNHEAVARSDLLIGAVCPGYLLVELLLKGLSLRRRLSASSLLICQVSLSIVQINKDKRYGMRDKTPIEGFEFAKYLLDGSQLHVLVPVADACLVGVAGATLHLLRSVLHCHVCFVFFPLSDSQGSPWIQQVF